MLCAIAIVDSRSQERLAQLESIPTFWSFPSKTYMVTLHLLHIPARMKSALLRPAKSFYLVMRSFWCVMMGFSCGLLPPERGQSSLQPQDGKGR